MATKKIEIKILKLSPNLRDDYDLQDEATASNCAQCEVDSDEDDEEEITDEEFEALKPYFKAVDQYCDGNYVEAVKGFRECAEKGVVEAQCLLATCYKDGKGVDIDETEALKWYLRAAKQGNTKAQMMTALSLSLIHI